MTITIPISVLYCWAFITAAEFVSMYFSYKSFKKKIAENELFLVLKAAYVQSPSWQLLYKQLFNPATYIFVGVLFALLSPLLFISSLFTGVKKLIGYKSPLQKKAEAEALALQKARDEAIKRSEEFMRSEGRGFIEMNDSPIAPRSKNEGHLPPGYL